MTRKSPKFTFLQLCRPVTQKVRVKSKKVKLKPPLKWPKKSKKIIKSTIFFYIFNILFFALGPKNLPITEGWQLALVSVPNNLSKKQGWQNPYGGGGFGMLAPGLLAAKWFFEPALKNFNQNIENCRRSSILSEPFLVKIMILDNWNFIHFL